MPDVGADKHRCGRAPCALEGGSTGRRVASSAGLGVFAPLVRACRRPRKLYLTALRQGSTIFFILKKAGFHASWRRDAHAGQSPVRDDEHPDDLRTPSFSRIRTGTKRTVAETGTDVALRHGDIREELPGERGDDHLQHAVADELQAVTSRALVSRSRRSERKRTNARVSHLSTADVPGGRANTLARTVGDLSFGRRGRVPSVGLCCDDERAGGVSGKENGRKGARGARAPRHLLPRGGLPRRRERARGASERAWTRGAVESGAQHGSGRRGAGQGRLRRPPAFMAERLALPPARGDARGADEVV